MLGQIARVWKNNMQGPLTGIKVVEAGMVVAGAMVTASLADLGAEVIKIEPVKGDEMRRVGQKKNGEPLLWRVIARNKQVVAVDLNKPEGADVVRKILATADVFVENFRPGRVVEFGLDYKTLSEINPKLVMVHLSGYGQTGPYSDRPGLGTLAEAFSGWSHVTGEPDGPPTLPYYPLADAFAALTGTYSILAGILGRQLRGGRGDEIDISLYEPILSFQGSMAIDYDQLGFVAKRRGNRILEWTPRNTYRTADGRWFVVSSFGSATLRLFRAMGRQDLATDESLLVYANRVERADEIDAAIADWGRSHTLAEILAAFEANEVIGGPVNDIAQLMADEHVAGRGTFVKVKDSVLGELRMQSVVPRFSENPGAIRWPGSPVIGADTRHVLLNAGVSEEAIKALHAARIINAPNSESAAPAKTAVL
jgi:crotonobetainyl-CoA:carnitine CoA-transferase CaiB-like acyl-CoA transferase